MSGLHVIFLGSKTAERHDRAVCSVPDNCGLGWKPYTVLVRSHGGTLAYKAFHGVRAFRAWLGGRKLTRYARGARGTSRYSLASAWIEDQEVAP